MYFRKSDIVYNPVLLCEAMWMYMYYMCVCVWGGGGGGGEGGNAFGN